MPFSIGSLYVVKTWDRDGSGRDRRFARAGIAASVEAPARAVVSLDRQGEPGR